MKFLTSIAVVVSLASGIYAQCNCAGRVYQAADVAAAVARSHTVNPNPPRGVRAYPHVFGNIERLPFPPACAALAGNYNEFPILPRSPPTSPVPNLFRPANVNAPTGQGPDRVIYKIQRNVPVFCGCVTHTGATHPTLAQPFRNC